MRIGIKIVSIVFLFALAACNKSSAPDCFKTTGKQTTITRTLTPFYAVDLQANLEMTLVNGSEYKVELFGGDNMLEKITTSVSDGTLTIDNKNTCNFVRGYKHHLKLTVTSPNFKFAVTNSIGNIIVDHLVQDTVFVYSEGGDIMIDGTYNVVRTSSHGNGNVYFNGSTNKMYVYMNGTCFLYADQCKVANYVFIESISLANAYIKAPDAGTFEYHLWKTGNIYYEGNPSVVSGKIEGKGAVIKK